REDRSRAFVIRPACMRVWIGLGIEQVLLKHWVKLANVMQEAGETPELHRTKWLREGGSAASDVAQMVEQLLPPTLTILRVRDVHCPSRWYTAVTDSIQPSFWADED